MKANDHDATRLRIRVRLHGRTLACTRCQGVGKVYHATITGQMLRVWRIDHDVSARRLAQHLKVSVSYISDLELGRREWAPALVERYIMAVTEAA